MGIGSHFGRWTAGLALGFGLAFSTALPAHASGASSVDQAFDQILGTDMRAPRTFDLQFNTPLEQLVGQIADGSKGRIGVAAVDLATGEQVSVLGDQRFPMASTSKIAIAATFMQGVEDGRWTLTSEFPMMVPVRSEPFSSAVAPVRPGRYYQAVDLIEMMITRSNNEAADALLKVVGGPKAVNAWVHAHGVENFHIDRDIATLVRDDGAVDPASHIETRDSATPKAMVKLLTDLYQGKVLSDSSRQVILGAMERCRTGVRRIKALLPDDAIVAHKTGSLHNTSSDIGLVKAPNGHTIAVAIYVTGQGSRLARESKIAHIALTLYDGYTGETDSGRQYASANY
ncbi:serine hydrolase [Tsuneonella mangrovi]|uniref:serine hydrolase n=1 Tax=Tsuneonella mangrovi TaxID=1982042 RepID=UPI000BA24A29|nr:serine hydrolase [Tsuneonella mangrovi]